MSAAAAPSAAAVLRVVRGAAVQRPAVRGRLLRVLLFLGGLVTVGFLYGGQAHAAEATAPAETVTTAGAGAAQDMRGATEDVVRGAATSGSSEASGASASADRGEPVPAADAPKPVQELRPAREMAEPVRAVARDAARPVTRPLNRTIVEPVAQPLFESLAESLAGSMKPILAQTPGLPHAPGLPQGLTPPLGTPSLDGNEPQTAPQLPSADNSALNPAFPAGTCGPAAGTPTATAATAATAVHRIFGVDRSVRAAAAARTTVDSPAPAPAPGQAPGKPCGIVPGALQQSGDSHTPRPGDQATHPAGGTAFAPAPGAVLAAAGEPTRERPGDILEFPG
ncbi:hypothetical protein [Streptomyces sp. AM8-1-1]|uniref:hypothetical protein n=1 Tax=Streptomyces sp. AM8-1-1 TaxID=3075825 RepID=UPI0028C4CC04|nr:hypothetical protein [Streptomyces sp. AM8-1-1]WNO72800.1 hypothetical protein RPQ07_14675 [Streptomyces sp. AM8-1-1]